MNGLTRYEVIGYDRIGMKIKHCITEPNELAALKRFLQAHPQAIKRDMIEVLERSHQGPANPPPEKNP